MTNNNINKLRNDFMKSYKKNDFFGAVLIGERIKALYKNMKSFIPDEFYAEDMFNLGYVYNEIERIDKAEETYRVVIKVYEKLNKKNIILARAYNNLAIILNSQNNYKNALIYFEKAYSIIKQTKDKNANANILYNLGGCYFDLSDMQSAIRCYLESLALRENKDLDYADNLNGLGYCYEQEKDYKTAENYFLSAIDIIKKNCGNCSDEYMKNLYYIGNVYEKDGNYMEAKNCYERSIEIVKLLIDRNHPYYAEILNRLATIYSRLNNDSKALMLRIKALNIIRESIGEEHIYYASSLKNIADIYYKKQEYKKAKDFYEKSFKIKEKIFGANNKEVSRDLLSIAKTNRCLKEYDEANKIIESLKNSVSSDDELYMLVLLEAIKLYITQCDTKKMYELYNMISETNTNLCFEDILKELKECVDNENFNANIDDIEDFNNYSNTDDDFRNDE